MVARRAARYAQDARLVRFRPVVEPDGNTCTWPGSSPTTGIITEVNAGFDPPLHADAAGAILTPADASVLGTPATAHRPRRSAQRRTCRPMRARRCGLTYYRHIFNPRGLAHHDELAKCPRATGNNLPEAALHHRTGGRPRTSAARRWWRPRLPCRGRRIAASETRA